MMKKTLYILPLLLVLIFSFTPSVSHKLVRNSKELQQAMEKAEPGDIISMANGVWKDVAIKFKAHGTKEKPITLRAETAGKVFVEGQSYLNLGGEYLVVDGLFFRNGYTPKKTVISFKVDSKNIAHHSKVTNCVLDGFTQLDRDVNDHWVEFWGRNNELSNCYIAGKSNPGPTVRVFLKGNEHIYNYHTIKNNYFGERPRLGGPHGETMQIGDSYTSMTPSHTQVENNLFERCNGEVEIISSKSNFNVFRHNVFFESEGSLVLRHGNYANIDGNIFIGNDNSKFIGGIRVINTGHWITNNYFYKLKGEEFRSPLAVMNGIPKSPLNRYNQVTDVVVAYNTYVDCETPFQFSVGANTSKSDVLPASEIRSARPIRTIVANNIIYDQQQDNKAIVKAYDTIEDVHFENNYANYSDTSGLVKKGISQEDMEMQKVSNWLFVPEQNIENVYQGFDFESIQKDLLGANREKNNSVGAITVPTQSDKIAIQKKQYGPQWFTPVQKKEKSKTITVKNPNDLVSALVKANAGDVLELKAATYKLAEPLKISKEITIKSSSKRKAVLTFENKNTNPLFQMLPGGKLRLENISLKGNEQQDAIATLDKNMSSAYNLWLQNIDIEGYKSVLKVSKGSFADTIAVKNSTIKNCINGIQLAEETDDKGDYSAEFVFIENSTFENVNKNVLNYYRGGYDESTIGGSLVLKNNIFKNSGSEESSKILLQTRGIVNIDFENNEFLNNPISYVIVLWGEKGQVSVNNSLKNSGEIKVEENLKMKLMY